MSPKQKIIISIVGILVIIGIILAFAFGCKKEMAEEELEQNITGPAAAIGTEPGTIVLPAEILSAVKKESTPEVEVTRLSSSFAERLGSYSNQSNFANLNDLKLFMTKEMKKWADNYIAKQKEQQKDISVYYGITTKALNTEINSLTENQAQVTVATQRREVKGDVGEPKVFYQDVVIELDKQGDTWKVDSATWQ